MTSWLLLAGGLLLGTVGMITVVSCFNANQVELYRWITGRAVGAHAARALLSTPARVVGSALGIASAGSLLTGIGLRALVDGLQPIALAISVVFIAVPVVVTAFYSVPSAVGRRWPDSAIRAVVPWVNRFASVFAPVLPADATVRPRIDLTHRQLSQPASESGGSDDLTLVSGVLEFAERQVREIMTPRTEVVAVVDTTPVSEVCQVFVESGFSRLPVYSDTLDNIVGMYYAFDLLKLSPGGTLPVRPITVAPTTRASADLMFEMQRERRQLAVVLDEFGGTAGIVTLNDMLTDLVEETFESSQAELEETEQPAVIEVAGAAALDDVAQQFATTLPGGAETIGGLLSSAAGRIPKPGERFVLSGLEFDVVEATATRVERVNVRRATVAAIQLEFGKKE